MVKEHTNDYGNGKSSFHTEYNLSRGTTQTAAFNPDKVQLSRYFELVCGTWCEFQPSVTFCKAHGLCHGKSRTDKGCLKPYNFCSCDMTPVSQGSIMKASKKRAAIAAMDRAVKRLTNNGDTRGGSSAAPPPPPPQGPAAAGPTRRSGSQP